MKEYKTFNQQLAILRKRGLIVPTDGSPKRFLEKENYSCNCVFKNFIR